MQKKIVLIVMLAALTAIACRKGSPASEQYYGKITVNSSALSIVQLEPEKQAPFRGDRGDGPRECAAAERRGRAVECAAGHDGVGEGEPDHGDGCRRRVDYAGSSQVNSTWGGARAGAKVAGSAANPRT